MINGNNIFISVDEHSAPFAATKANEIQVGAEKIPISSPMTGDWEEHIVGRKRWGFSINSLVTTLDDIRKVLIVGNTYTITVYGREGSTVTAKLQGRATCLEARAGMTRGSLATGSFSFDGNGMLYIPVTSITLSQSSLSLDVGASQQLTATVQPSSASVQQLQWSSSDESIAIVGNNGNVTAVGEGTCTITCSAEDESGVTATCSVEVHPVLVTGITLSSNTLTLALNQGRQNPITAVVSPDNATNKQLTWSSSDQIRFTVTQNGNDYTVMPNVPGHYSLIASATDGSAVTAICDVTVIQQ